METRDDLLPTGKWEFDSRVTACFENMLQRSIPQYEAMRHAVNVLAAPYVHPEYSVVDLGCSNGEGLSQVLVAAKRPPFQAIGCDNSEPMLEAARFGLGAHARFENIDLRHEYPTLIRPASVTLSVLTVQFAPIEHRQDLIRRVAKNTVSGGVVILVEKILGGTPELDLAFVTEYHRMKRRNGYTYSQIEAKRKSLEGVLTPMTAAWNEQLLRSAGFKDVECFWRYMNFAGWIARL
jgi:tRNA (cmo5U34)-methyltransferase